MTTTIGLLGKKQVGKDTLAARLVSEFGYTRLSFADALRALLYQTNPIGAVVQSGRSFKSWTVQEIVDANGWEQAKKIGVVRDLLKDVGMSVRNVLGEDTWVNIVEEQIRPGGRYVITDVRFPNEYDLLYRVPGRGVAVRILRPEVDDGDKHESETALDDVFADHTILNAGNLTNLYLQAEQLVKTVEAP